MPAIALTRILVPTDFSETSAAAVKYAVALADAFGARDRSDGLALPAPTTDRIDSGHVDHCLSGPPR